MKKVESSIMGMLLSLSLISVVAAALLSVVNSATRSKIEAIGEQTKSEAIKQVVIGDSDIEFAVSEPKKVENLTLYSVRSLDGSLLGYAVEGFDGNAFGGNLSVMVGIAPTGEILGYEVLDHSETPGLGANAGSWFKQSVASSKDKVSRVGAILLGAPSKGGNHNIVGMNPSSDNFTVTKDGGDVDAITASTITSRAFLRAVVASYNAAMSEQLTITEGE